MLTERQLLTIEGLEFWFNECRRAGLVFVGMDDQILAFDENTLLDAGYADDPHKAMKELRQGEPVRTFGAYKDSGGW